MYGSKGPLGRGMGRSEVGHGEPMGRGLNRDRSRGLDRAREVANPNAGGLFDHHESRRPRYDWAQNRERVNHAGQRVWDTAFDDNENPFSGGGWDPSSWEDRMAQMQAWRNQMMAPQMGQPQGLPPVANTNARRWGGY